jgi:hypothetical protein
VLATILHMAMFRALHGLSMTSFDTLRDARVSALPNASPASNKRSAVANYEVAACGTLTAPRGKLWAAKEDAHRKAFSVNI